MIPQSEFSEGVKFEEQKGKIYYASKDQLSKMFALFSAYTPDDYDEIKDWLKKTANLLDMVAGLSNHVNSELNKLSKFKNDDFAKMLINNCHNELAALSGMAGLKQELLNLAREHRFTELHMKIIIVKVKQILNGLDVLEEHSKINAVLMRKGYQAK